MQPASQDPTLIYGAYGIILVIAFLIVGIFCVFSREASRRAHLEKWLFIVLNLLAGTFSEAPRSKTVREETDHEAL